MTLRRPHRLLLVAALVGGVAPLAAQQADSADAPEAPARPVRQSWTSDRRAFLAGDIITVNIDEYTLASANTGNTATDNRRRTADWGLNIKTAATGQNLAAGYTGTNNADLQQRGEATRQNRFTAEMTVRVVGVDAATGILKVEGHKLVTIDGAKQEVVLTGLVRPQDVGAFNQVDSQRVGELKLDYKNTGDLGKPKNGLFWKLFGWAFP